MSTLNKKQLFARLDKLCVLIPKYAHLWGAEPSTRLWGWVLEFDGYRLERWPEFEEWALSRGYTHQYGFPNGGDLLA